jgi:hypothetical protein
MLIQGTGPALAPAGEKPKTVDQLLDELAAIKSQKEELERKEKAIIGALQERLRAQRERLEKLGVEASKPVATAAAPTPKTTPAGAADLGFPVEKLGDPDAAKVQSISPRLPDPPVKR